MKRFLLSLALLGAVASAANALPNSPEIIPAKGGSINITPIYHASMQIEYQGFVIQVDPFSAGDYTGTKKADWILITHTHSDHFDKAEMTKLTDSQVLPMVIAPRAVATQLAGSSYAKGRRLVALDNGQSFRDHAGRTNNHRNVFVDLLVQAVPMYNLVRGPKPGQKFHPKGEFNGYILTIGGKRIYIAGDTEATPEMKALKNIDVAFLPMNLPFTMTPQEAAVGAKSFKPKVVYPYHYRYPFTKPNDNPQQFAKAMAGSGVVVKIRDWYGHPAK